MPPVAAVEAQTKKEVLAMIANTPFSVVFNLSCQNVP